MTERGDAGEPLGRGPRAAVERTVDAEPQARREAVERGRAEATPGDAGEPKEERAPSEHSFWPVVLALGLVLVGFGVLTSLVVAALGGIVVLVAVIGWLWQPWVS